MHHKIFDPKMEELSVHFRHMVLWEFKNNINTKKNRRDNCSSHSQGVITETTKYPTGLRIFVLAMRHRCVYDRIIPFELLKHNQKLNADLYVQSLQCVHENLPRKSIDLVNKRNVVLLKDNVKLHLVRILR